MILKIYVQPGASKTEFCGKHGDSIKIRIKAPPVDGKANEVLIAFLAEHYNCKKSQITIKSGNTSRLKTIVIEGL